MGYIGAGITRFNTADELTVTGDAQIDTTTLVVDSTNNRVGVGNASPATALDVTGTVTADGLTVDGNKVGISNAAPASVRSSDTIINMQDSFITVGATNINLSHNVFHNGTNWVRSTTDSVGHLQVANNQLNFFNSTSDSAGTTVSFTKRMNINGGGDISFFADNGTTQGLYWDASTQRLGLGITSPSSQLHIQNSGSASARIISGTTGSSTLFLGDTDEANQGSIQYNHGSDFMRFYTNNAERIRIDSSGNVGIGTTSVDEKLDVNGNAKLTGTGRIIKFDKNGSGEDNAIYYDNTTADNNLFIGRDSSNVAFRTGGSERMRISTGGHLLVGKTAQDSTNTVGFEAKNTGEVMATVDGAPTAFFNRKTSDGDVVVFRKDNTTVGSISSSSGKTAITLDPRSAATTGSGFLGGDGVIFPSDKTGVASDADVSLGGASTRFKDLHLSSNVYLGGSGGTSTIFSPTSFAIDIDSNNDQTDRAFVIKNNGSNDIARFTEAGNFLVGTTSLDIANNGSNTGFVVNSNGALEVGSSATVLTLNR